jgi:hypothetical protein
MAVLRPGQQFRDEQILGPGEQLRHLGHQSSAARTARSASSSAAIGVPTAMTASPMNPSTTPPYQPTTVRATAQYTYGYRWRPDFVPRPTILKIRFPWWGARGSNPEPMG